MEARHYGTNRYFTRISTFWSLTRVGVFVLSIFLQNHLRTGSEAGGRAYYWSGEVIATTSCNFFVPFSHHYVLCIASRKRGGCSDKHCCLCYWRIRIILASQHCFGSYQGWRMCIWQSQTPRLCCYCTFKV